jgi:hypothetical protein
MKKIVVHIALVLMVGSVVLVLQVDAAINGKIVYVSNRNGIPKIYVKKPEVTGIQYFTTNTSDNRDPAWFPRCNA